MHGGVILGPCRSAIDYMAQEIYNIRNVLKYILHAICLQRTRMVIIIIEWPRSGLAVHVHIYITLYIAVRGRRGNSYNINI